MAARFRRDPLFAAAISTTPPPEVLAKVHAVAEEVAAVARKRAPDDPATPGSSIAAGIEVDLGTDRARVNALDFKSHWLEFGTVRTRAQPYLRPAAEQVVGRLEAGPER